MIDRKLRECFYRAERVGKSPVRDRRLLSRRKRFGARLLAVSPMKNGWRYHLPMEGSPRLVTETRKESAEVETLLIEETEKLKKLKTTETILADLLAGRRIVNIDEHVFFRMTG